jgi:hypothetical protein
MKFNDCLACWLVLTLPVAVLAEKFGDFTYTSSNGTITIIKYTGSDSAVTIPSIINTLPVTGIGPTAFSSCDSLTYITVPASVTSIDDWAFSYAPLTAIDVDNANSVYSSVDGVLFNKNQTTLIQFPGGKVGRYTIPNSVVIIRNGAFNRTFRSEGLTAIDVNIENAAFSSLDGVLFDKGQTILICYPTSKVGDSYGIPDSVISIGDWAFQGCISLTNIAIGNSVTNIGHQSFIGCISLATATIPDSVISIGDWAFTVCVSLTRITIGNRVARIGRGAFSRETSSLTSVFFKGDAPSLGDGVFDGAYNATIYYLPRTTGWGTTFGFRPTVQLISTPLIVLPPAGLSTCQGGVAVFSIDATSDTPMSYQWRFNGQSITGATNATLTVTGASTSDAGAYSVIVSNWVGLTVSANASLAVLTAIIPGAQPTAPVYPPLPVAEAGKDSLVIITHGRTVGADTHAWVDEMKTAIKDVVPSNWMVLSYKWTDQARVAEWEIPFKLYSRAKSVGSNLGRSIMNIAELTPNKAWKHVHLIGHSAGAAVIQSASRIVAIESPLTTTIHTTFLDSYTGSLDGGRNEYGKYATWADSYYAIDDETYDRTIFGRTEGLLNNAHNADVTWLDPDAKPAPDIYVFSGSTPAILPQVYSSHSWPQQFYQKTILGSLPLAENYGFPMSKEGGGWPDKANFSKGNTPVVLNGPQVPTQNSLAVRIDQTLDIGALSYATSEAGATFSGGGSFHLGGNSALLAMRGELSLAAPAADLQSLNSTPWLAVAVSVTSLVNFVSFDSSFTGLAFTNALLTVYWGAEEIGLVDQLSAQNDLVKNRFALPADLSEGLYTLAFRLDTFGDDGAGVSVTNISLGYIGDTEPISLDIISVGSGGTPKLYLSGTAGRNYLMKASSNLVDWTSTAFIANQTGSVQWIDEAASNQVQRFYRAVLP